MKKRSLSILLALLLIVSVLPVTAAAVSDADNGDWSAQSVTRTGTAEAELMVRVGDIDALNDEYAIEDGYNPFTATQQRSHGYPWAKDDADAPGTDRIYVGSAWTGEAADGYGGNYQWYAQGEDEENAYGDGALVIPMKYDAAGVKVKSALLQLCIDDFQAVSWESNFTVKLNGKDAPFIAELLNHVDQTGPTSYITSAIIPASFYPDVASGSLTIEIDETTGMGDGFAVDFAKLLVNYNSNVFTGRFTGETEPGATVRLLGTSTTIVASDSGRFEFEAIPGLNAVRASKDGYVENYDYGIVISSAAVSEEDWIWDAYVWLEPGQGSPDIDFSEFGETAAWDNASTWATEGLTEANALGLIPDCLKSEDLTLPITRAEFAAVSVKLFEAMTYTQAEPAPADTFSDTQDPEILKAFALGVTNGTNTKTMTFEPEKQISREQAATMLTRVYKKIMISGWTLETDKSYDETFRAMFTMPALFEDDAEISAYAKDSVYFMAANGIVNGVSTTRYVFAPKLVVDGESTKNYATREQALLMSVRMVNNLG